MELRHLRYFLAVAEELHFGRAAKRLQMAQPPLSQQIKQLERELGVQLFARTRRKVSLTVAGEVLQQESQQIFQQLEQTVTRTQQAARGEVGRLAIAFVSSAMYSLLPDYLKQFREQYPQIDIILHELSSREQIQGLLENRLDIGLMRPPVEHDALQAKSVLQESLVAALPLDHRLASQEHISVRALQDELFILFPRPMATRLYDQIISFCDQEGGFSPTVVQQAAQMQTILSLVAADIGVTIVPESLRSLQRRGVCFRSFTEPTPQAEVCIVCKQKPVAPTVEAFLQGMAQVI
ncbi:MAG: LysR family transcriptional regulator [Leptolyngbya sp. SIO3F4]|nr:LysR family transcriptional regulator [Leptolyngbya sp. SIO3F4]